ncbi:gustatory receptor 68a-like [Thrips palmi]|uniref:Gustatory receptor 68a-like n=1 Tax=Thrips palmi TaxID=161013 RepID=A0A6P9A6X6_THRPL|nr:gustatory receptor 68a-like [Thrips palmi]
MVLSTFLATTTSLYIRLTNRDDGSNLALAWSVLVAIMLLVVLHAGELVKRESRCTTELTQRILIHHELPPVLRQEVRSFSRQLLHQGLRVSVYGFLQLDYSMLQGMIGSVTTYLIMVIQLSPEENDNSEDVHAGSAATKT